MDNTLLIYTKKGTMVWQRHPIELTLCLKLTNRTIIVLALGSLRFLTVVSTFKTKSSVTLFTLEIDADH